MPRFNRTTSRPARTATGPITTAPAVPYTPPQTSTHEGAPAFLRTPKGELFLLATTNIDLTADAFYEARDTRVQRFVTLVGEVAVDDPDWTFNFLDWLRKHGNIRTAAIVGAVEAARAMVAAGITGSRAIINTVCQRPDEPGEVLAYFTSRYGMTIPKPIKRGVADAAIRLYSERSLLKYDTASYGFRFGRVLDLTHPKPTMRPIDEANADVEPDEMQAWINREIEKGTTWLGRKKALFQYAHDRMRGHDDIQQIVGTGDAMALPMVYANVVLRSEAAENPETLLNPESLAKAGMTWEDALSLVGSKVDKAALWKAMIPSMGFMARLRNLRNFDQAGLTDADVKPVLDMLVDPDQVATSRQLPLRFLSAYRHTDNLRWAYPLEQALDLSLGNVPVLTGRTLILVDTSGSMAVPYGRDSKLHRWDTAVAFGLALARRAEHADVVSFSTGTKVFEMRKGESLLAGIQRWKNEGYFLNGGTYTTAATRAHFKAHDRVIILTDEQSHDGNPGGVIPHNTMLWTCNLAGYRPTPTLASPTRITVGGLTDQTFGLIPTVEAGAQGHWPWEQQAA